MLTVLRSDERAALTARPDRGYILTVTTFDLGGWL